MTKILVADDDRIYREILSELLGDAGYAVVTAVDGDEVLAKAVSEAPDLIIMDMSMPRLTGFEATRRIRSGKETGHIPIIALSAHDAAGDMDEAHIAGCASYVIKPVDPELLLKAVQDAL